MVKRISIQLHLVDLENYYVIQDKTSGICIFAGLPDDSPVELFNLLMQVDIGNLGNQFLSDLYDLNEEYYDTSEF